MMTTIEERLDSETQKWLARLERRMRSVHVADHQKAAKVKNEMANVQAYMKDCSYFLGKKDYLNAFEAVIYAWGILETLERIGLAKAKGK